MSRRLLSILAILALLVAPIHMIGGAAAAMPHHPAKGTDGHCAESLAPDPVSGEQDAAIDCLIACAGLPGLPASAPAGLVEPTAAPAPTILASLHGLSVEAATPPPRIS